MWRRLRSLSRGAARGLGGISARALSTGAPLGLVQSVLSIPKRYPFQFACGFTSLKTFSADIFVQKSLEKRETIDWRRSTVFAVFGFCYQGAFQYIVYVKIVAGRILTNAGAFAAKPFREKLRDPRGIMGMLGQVGLANFIMDPFFCLPTYYITKEAILGEKKEGQTPLDSVKQALSLYRVNMWEDVTTSWKIWMPAQLFNFGLNPLHLRVPFISVVSFGYCVVLSVMRGAQDEAPKEEALRLHETLSLHMHINDQLKKQHMSLAADIKDIIQHKADQHGNLDHKAFETIFSNLGVRDRRALRSFFKAFDLDRNGSISPEEFATLVLAMSDEGSPAHRLGKIFELCDLDGDGLVHREELETMLRAVLRIKANLLQGHASTSPGLLVGLRWEKTRHMPSPERLTDETRALTGTVWAEANHENTKGMTAAEFKAWAESGSKAAEEVIGLFRVFEPHAIP
eukprot:CAMPEP_0167820888 /NCGR_PEP_ID=MMETSP0112_2-20121227/6408_1 /TAXON_ID=91324 /ORGANISM="Lotharella globosa, Strain CCCM811" /LENGTH=456 /DNA_ID=CAMNT_0007721629 /DNA_START=23 /DNA_END=1393 /DNA_ORIENTATION=-